MDDSEDGISLLDVDSPQARRVVRVTPSKLNFGVRYDHLLRFSRLTCHNIVHHLLNSCRKRSPLCSLNAAQLTVRAVADEIDVLAVSSTCDAVRGTVFSRAAHAVCVLFRIDQRVCAGEAAFGE